MSVFSFIMQYIKKYKIQYITGYYQPYAVTEENAQGAVAYKDFWISREAAEVALKEMESMTDAETESEIGTEIGTVENLMLQEMGQKIVYEMREDVFTHIHSLSLTFFNTTPVGKLVTRVSNDTEAVNELFSTILIKLFKNSVKIIGYAVVMLSIDVYMAGISFLLLPFVAVMTFVFRYLSHKAYQLTRTRITELNTFLSEHISGMTLIQVFAREDQKYEEFAGNFQMGMMNR